MDVRYAAYSATPFDNTPLTNAVSSARPNCKLEASEAIAVVLIRPC
jgi:hypothetical protein